MRHSLMLIKPDATARNLIGTILKSVEDAGFKITNLKEFVLTDELASEFYEEHRSKEFYGELVQYMQSGKIVAVIVTKDDAVNELRRLVGSTNPEEAAPGTIRGNWGESLRRNSVHASDCDVSAKREINLIFTDNKLF